MDNYKIKSSVLKSIMNNPSLRRSITESLEAPLGSTKRNKARDILSSFNRVVSNKSRQDGQGGPSVITANPGSFNFNGTPSPFQPQTYSNIRIFPTTPDPKPVTNINNWSNLNSPTISSNASFPNQSLNLNKPTPPTIQEIAKNYPIPTNTIKTGASFSGKTSPFISGSQLGSGTLLSELNKSIGQSPLTPISPSTFGQSFDKGSLQNLMKTLGSLNQPLQTQIQKPTSPTQPTTPTAPTTQNQPVQGPTTTPTTETQQSSISGPYSGDAAIQSQWDALSPTDQKRYKPVFDAAYSKLGAGTFFYGAMSDKNTLKQLFPGLQDKDLPTGASLAGQMVDLQKTLKSQYGLDELLKQKNQLANESGNFTQDMTDYISGRDEFLGQVNKMIETAEGKSLDISDPYSANSMKNYLNYLYVLKGRQSKNYADYLNSAITYQNNKISQVDNEYTNMVNAYNTDFKTQSDIKTADYNQWYTVLTDMYNKLDGSLASQLDLQEKQANIDKVYSGIAIDAANAQIKTTPSWFKEMDQYKDYLIDSSTQKKGQLLPGVDLASVIARASDNGLNPQGVLDTFQIGAKNSIAASQGDIKSLDGTINNIKDTLRNFNTTTNGQYKDIINSMAQGLGEQTQYQIGDYVTNNAAAITTAIKDLGNRRNSNVNDFIKNHPNLDSNIAKSLFDYYKSNPEYSNKPIMLFSSTGKISEADIPQIKNIIAKSIAGSWANDLVSSVNQY